LAYNGSSNFIGKR
jgi:hypothetical protein